MGGQVEKIVTAIGDVAAEKLDDAAEKAIKDRVDISETEKEQLVKSRRGQGLFRSRVEVLEPCCRITGVSAREHLRASHIKPWRDSTNVEKLDGNNGLLLAPHVDHLFDRGYISFTDEGELLVSSALDTTILKLWGIAVPLKGPAFSVAQRAYLAYHRSDVLKK